LDLPTYLQPQRDRQLEAELVLEEGTLHVLDVHARGNGFDEVIEDAGGVMDENARTRVLVRPDLFDGYALTTTSNLPYFASAAFQTPDGAGPSYARLTWTDAGQPDFEPQVVFA